jgi:serine/threonine-protein kinase
VITKCLEKSPARRYKSIVELAQALQEFASVEGVTTMLRISAVVRSAKERSSSPAPGRIIRADDAPTLDSAGSPQVRSSSAPGPSKDEKPTQTGWGHSQDTVRRSRRRALFGIAAGMAAVVGGFLLWRLALDRTRDVVSAAGTAGASATELKGPPAWTAPAALPTDLASATAQPATREDAGALVAANPTADAGSSAAETSEGKGPAHATAIPPASSIAKRPPPKVPAGEKPATTPPPAVHTAGASGPAPSDDPLEGRR